MSAALVGSTGLVINNVYAYSRRKLPVESSKLTTIESKETDTWPSKFPSEASIFLSALGTTRAQAGGLENQRKIDLDLNIALAKAAKEAGVEIYVLISSGSANSSSMVPYTKLKGEIEDGVRAVGFKYTVIIRPGLIVGEREDSRPAEYLLRQTANFMGRLKPGLKNFWAQDADAIAKAAVNAGVQCLEGKREPGVWELGGSDIISLGKSDTTEQKL